MTRLSAATTYPKPHADYRRRSACEIIVGLPQGIKRNVAQAFLPVLAVGGEGMTSWNIASLDRHCKSGLQRSDIMKIHRGRGRPARRAACIRAENVSRHRYCRSGLERSDIIYGLSTDRRTPATQEIPA